MFTQFWLNYDNMLVVAMAIPFAVFGLAIAGTLLYVQFTEGF